jgi:hypothetical protein
MSLDDVSKVTKIQPRILERIETGKLDGLPAEVFVRGFVRSFARCVGLDEDEALRRYAACGLGSGSPELTPTVRALVEAMVDLAPGSAVTPRAAPRRMRAVDGVDGVGPVDLVEPVDLVGLVGVVDLATAAAGSMRDLPVSGAIDPTGEGARPAGNAVGVPTPRDPASPIVETMMLPETGTVVLPVLAEPRVEPDRAVEATSVPPVATAATPGGSADVPSLAEPVEVAPMVAPEQVAPADQFVPAEQVVSAAQMVSSMPSVPMLTPSPSPSVMPVVAAVAVEPAARFPAASEAMKKKRGRRNKGRHKRAGNDATAGVARPLLATGTPAGASPVVVATAATNASKVSSGTSGIDEPIATATWAPRMPQLAASSSAPWRRPVYVAAASAAAPSLVIDDADPDSAERVLEERAETHVPRRSFLPPILLDREDRSARQGGLTLAVIILLIAATLTLSYLMRRPSASGDGMTRLDTPAGTLGVTVQGPPAAG